MKKEYKSANKTREGYIDESDEEDEEVKLTGAGKNLHKTLKKLEKDGGYDDSDDEKNPYATSVSLATFRALTQLICGRRRKRKRSRNPCNQDLLSCRQNRDRARVLCPVRTDQRCQLSHQALCLSSRKCNRKGAHHRRLRRQSRRQATAAIL